MQGVLQHQDSNISPASYKYLAHDELLVTKIFYTIQGEGPHAGRPAVFVRLAGCNRGRKDDMGCAFCDTAFAFGAGKRMTFAAVAEKIVGYAYPLLLRNQGNEPLIVITGGEPMLQDNLVMFITFLNRQGIRSVQIESNGDRIVTGFRKEMADLVVSPKATVQGYRKLKSEVIVAASAFKFVVSAVSAPYQDLPDWTKTLPCPVYLSPIAVYKREHSPGEAVSAWDASLIDQEATRRNYRHAAALAMREGYTLSIQQHLFYELE